MIVYELVMIESENAEYNPDRYTDSKLFLHNSDAHKEGIAWQAEDCPGYIREYFVVEKEIH